MAELEESAREEEVELSGVADEEFEREGGDMDGEEVAWSRAGIRRGPDFLFSGRGGISPSESRESGEEPWYGDGVEVAWEIVRIQCSLRRDRKDEGS